MAAAVVAVATMALMSMSSADARPTPVATAAPPPPAPSRPATSYFAAPTGTPTSDGSREQPLDLSSALSSKGPLAPGDTLWLRGGVYRGTFASDVSGNPNAAIYVKVLPGEHVVLDGAGSLQATLDITGSDIWFWGFDITNSDPQRTFDTPSNGNTRRATGVSISAPRVRLINLSIHDALTGVTLSEKADGSVLDGCLIYNNGIREPQGGIGHGVLLSTTGHTELTDVVTFNNLGRGINAGSGQAAATLILDGLTSFNNGDSSGGETVFKLENLFVEGAGTNVSVTNSHLYHAPGKTGQNLRLDNRRGMPGKLTMTTSILVGGSSSLSMANWREAVLTENLFYLRDSPNPNVDQTIARVQAANTSDRYTWNHNTYVDQSARGYPFIFNQATNAYGGGNLSYGEWQQASQFDPESGYGRKRPTGAQVFVRPDRHEPGRGLVIVYNWDHEPSVFVPLDALELNAGDAIEVLDVDRASGPPLLEQAYAGKPIAIPIAPLSTSEADSAVAIQSQSTKPEFAVFVVRKAFAGPSTRTTR